MTLIIDERLKHRLVGIAVIVSIAAIFTPAMMKKSSQGFDRTNIAIKLPAKPTPPAINLPTEKVMFHSVKIAHVDIPSISNEKKPTSVVAKALPIAIKTPIQMVTKPVITPEKRLATNDKSIIAKPRENKPAIAYSARVAATKVTNVATNSKKKPVTKPIMAQTKPKLSKLPLANYSVQLATFSQQTNAISLVTKLKSKGYKAFLNKSNTPKGTVYKVLVGQVTKKQQAQVLQQQLASMMQIKGFVVPTTGIS